MTHTINETASGATKARIGEHVTLIEYAPNGRSALVLAASGRKEWYPATWLSGVASVGESESCADSANKEITS